MKIQKVLPLSCLFVGLAALPSLAGSSYVENSYNLRSIFNGRSSTKVDVREVYQGHRSAGSNAVKNEWGRTTVTEANDGRYFNERESFDIRTSSFARESGDFRNITNVSVRESYDFSGFDKVHRVTSGFDF